MPERAASTEVFRTPDERFQGLPDFDFEPHYREVDGLRLAHLDVGEGRPILLIHGEPTWSFIWRKVIPPLVDAGFRCIAPDLAGCGRSDKPSDLGWYSLERHVALTSTLLTDLDLRDLTLVLHDWGGTIGLTLTVAEPDRVARAVILDTALDPTEVWMSERWVEFRDFVERTEDLPVGWVMRATLHNDPGDEVIAAYDAPYLGPESKVALRALPLSVKRTDRTPEGVATVLEALRNDPRPFHIIWGENDTILTATTAERFATSIGRQVDEWIPSAGHGLPEDQGQLLGERIAAWLAEVAPSS
ncbi:MAG: alpha/beta fold hydrolase [Actinomycetota bacterium]|nr:alpha/beta fold hydrolase [Actinomycetota bacterium]